MNNLRYLRNNTGLSQLQFAQLINVSQQAVTKWETGEALPRADKLPEIAKILHCSIEDLFKEV